MNLSIDTLFDEFFDLSEYEFLERVKKYYESNKSLNIKDSSGTYLIHLAAENECLNLIRWLVENHVDLEVKNYEGWTPLLLAVDSDIDSSIQNNTPLKFDTTLLLIQFGCDIGYTTNSGHSVFSIAKGYGDNNYKYLNEKISNLSKNK